MQQQHHYQQELVGPVLRGVEAATGVAPAPLTAPTLALSTPSPPAATTSTAAAAPSTPTNSRLLYLIATQGAESSERCDGSRPAGARYTRDSVRALLQLMGCKPRLAHKIMGLVFTSIEAAVAPAGGGAGGRQQRTSRRAFAVHAHGGGGHIAVSLPRADFMQLVSAAAAHFAYKIAPTSDELKVATG